MPKSSKVPEDFEPASSQQALWKLRRINALAVLLVLAFGVLNMFPHPPAPLLFAKFMLGIAGVIVIATGTIRFSQWSGEEYAHQRGTAAPGHRRQGRTNSRGRGSALPKSEGAKRWPRPHSFPG